MPIDRRALCKFIARNPWVAFIQPPCVKPSTVVAPPVVDCGNYEIRFFKDKDLEDPVNIAEGIDYPEETIYAVVVNTETEEILGNVEWESVFSGDLKLAATSSGNIWTKDGDGADKWIPAAQFQGEGKEWYGIASSADGTKLAATEYGGNIWTKDGDGADKWIPAAQFQGEGEGKAWEAIASSSGVWGQEILAGSDGNTKAFKLGGVGQLGTAALTAIVSNCTLEEKIEFSRCGTALAAHQAVIRVQAGLETINPALVPFPNVDNLRNALVAAFTGATGLLQAGKSITTIPAMISGEFPTTNVTMQIVYLAELSELARDQAQAELNDVDAISQWAEAKGHGTFGTSEGNLPIMTALFTECVQQYTGNALVLGTSPSFPPLGGYVISPDSINAVLGITTYKGPDTTKVPYNDYIGPRDYNEAALQDLMDFFIKGKDGGLNFKQYGHGSTRYSITDIDTENPGLSYSLLSQELVKLRDTKLYLPIYEGVLGTFPLTIGDIDYLTIDSKNETEDPDDTNIFLNVYFERLNGDTSDPRLDYYLGQGRLVNVSFQNPDGGSDQTGTLYEKVKAQKITSIFISTSTTSGTTRPPKLDITLFNASLKVKDCDTPFNIAFTKDKGPVITSGRTAEAEGSVGATVYNTTVAGGHAPYSYTVEPEDEFKIGTDGVVTAAKDLEVGEQTLVVAVTDANGKEATKEVALDVYRKLVADDAADYDAFGNSVAISDNTIVVGAAPENLSGSVYVFEREDDGTWTRTEKLTAGDDAAKFDRLGYSVAISDDTIVVAAPGDDGEKGSAYVFERSDGTWSQTKKLVKDKGDAAEYDFFGKSVAISGGTIVVGAWGDNADGTYDSGSAYVYGIKTTPAVTSGSQGRDLPVGYTANTVVYETTVAGGKGPYTYTVSSGDSKITINETSGVIKAAGGLPVGEYTFIVTASDEDGSVATQDVTLTVFVDTPLTFAEFVNANGGREYRVSKCDTSAEGHLIIPLTYKDIPVTTIGERAFYYCPSLTSIAIPDSVTTIKSYAFYGCSSLTSIAIPDSVTTIGIWAFEECSSLASITIPDSVISIGYGAFSGCRSLACIAIPDSVTSIGNNAFSGCRSLACIAIGDSVTTIGESAFYQCSSLTNITIPPSVATIEGLAFYQCSSLTNITIPPSVTTIEARAFEDCSSLIVIKFEGGAPTTETKAFDGLPNNAIALVEAGKPSPFDVTDSEWKGLTIRVLDDSNNPVTVGPLTLEEFTNKGNIEYRVFKCETNAKGSLTILSAYNDIPVTSIGERAFQRCVGLTSVTIPNSVTSIGLRAFDFCYGLTSVTVPDSVTSIGERAFQNCKGLTSVTIPNSVTSIGFAAFTYLHGLTSLTIPDSVTSIGERAFSYCRRLTSVTIPDSVTEIESEAFKDCSLLAEVAFQGEAPKTADDAFDGISSDAEALVEFVNRDSFTQDEVLSTAFKITVLGEVVVGDLTFAEFVNANGEREYRVFDCKSDAAGSLTIPSTYNDIPVTSIGEKAFADCSELTSVTIPDSVTSIEDRAFAECSELTSVTIPVLVTSIGASAFTNCSSLTSVTIPACVETVGDYAFQLTGLTSVTIPASVKIIGDYAFDDCSQLEIVTFKGKAPDTGTAPFSNLPEGAVALVKARYLDSFDTYVFLSVFKWKGLIIKVAE